MTAVWGFAATGSAILSSFAEMGIGNSLPALCRASISGNEGFFFSGSG